MRREREREFREKREKASSIDERQATHLNDSGDKKEEKKKRKNGNDPRQGEGLAPPRHLRPALQAVQRYERQRRKLKASKLDSRGRDERKTLNKTSSLSLSEKKLSLFLSERAAKAAARQAAREAPADVSTWFPAADGPWEETRAGKRAAAEAEEKARAAAAKAAAEEEEQARAPWRQALHSLSPPFSSPPDPWLTTLAGVDGGGSGP